MSKTVVEGRPICDVRISKCRCYKDAGHMDEGDKTHECDPNRCTGAWEGEGDSFVIVRLPFPVREPTPWDFL